MQIIPVLDLKSGQAVHAIRGEREGYAPVLGMLGSGDDPVALATAYRDQLGCDACYVADLDAIAGQPGHTDTLRTLAQVGVLLWVDAGISSPSRALALADLGVTKIIVGSETLPSMDQLTLLATQAGPSTLVLSVDLKDAILRAPPGIDSPQQLVRLAAGVGLEDVILLDLARVGAGAGPPLDLLTSLRPHFPELAFYAGGGVRHRADLDALAEAGAAGALIATAFHRGILTATDVRAYHA